MVAEAVCAFRSRSPQPLASRPERTAFRALFASLLAACCLVGCGGGEGGSKAGSGAASGTKGETTDGADGDRTGGRSRSSVPAAEVLGTSAVSSAEFGVLSGEVRFLGQAPERFVMGAAKKPECSHHPEVDQRSNGVIVNDGKLVNAYVYLKSGVDAARIPPATDRTVRLEQKGCMYVPRAVALRVGERLAITNDDPTAHNVHSTGKRNGEANKSMGAGQPPIEFLFERSERPVPFKCDLHPWMAAEVWVEEHPWFALSAEDGTFRLLDVPPGDYVIEALHQDKDVGRTAARVTVEAGRETRIALTLP